MLSSQSDTDLFARVLALGPEHRRAIAERLDAAGGLFGVFRAGAGGLRGVLDAESTGRLDALLELVTRLVAPPELPSVIESAADVADYFRPRLIFLEVESVWVLSLDVRGRPAGCARVAAGTLTSCLVHPREVFAAALQARAASIVLVHNHPSGDPEPSPEDEALTDRLTAAGEVLGIPLVDHVIVARHGYRSLGGRLGRGLREAARLRLEAAARPRERRPKLSSSGD